MKRSSRITFAFALLVSAALQAPAQAKGVPGAIFTTDLFGNVVNGNQYTSKCAVYLDGGPGPNAPANAAGLPDGDYYFQVTDPSGEQLLSTDPVSNRMFTVTGGVITGHSGSHPTGMDQDHSAVTISLADANCPADFLTTPNNGGVYKVWATPVADFAGDPGLVDNECGNGCFHGFAPSKSKTDNFKVEASEPTFCLTVLKQFRDAAGAFQPAGNWLMSVTDGMGITNSQETDDVNGEVRFCGLTPGTYTVTETLKPDTEVVGLIVGTASLPPDAVDTVYTFTWKAGDAEPVIVFQNAPVLPPM